MPFAFTFAWEAAGREKVTVLMRESGTPGECIEAGIGSLRIVAGGGAGQSISIGAFFVCAERAPAPTSQPAARLIAIHAHRIGARRVIGSFLRDKNVMRVTLLHRGARDHDEAALGPQLFDRPR